MGRKVSSRSCAARSCAELRGPEGTSHATEAKLYKSMHIYIQSGRCRGLCEQNSVRLICVVICGVGFLLPNDLTRNLRWSHNFQASITHLHEDTLHIAKKGRETLHARANQSIAALSACIKTLQMPQISHVLLRVLERCRRYHTCFFVVLSDASPAAGQNSPLQFPSQLPWLSPHHPPRQFPPPHPPWQQSPGPPGAVDACVGTP